MKLFTDFRFYKKDYSLFKHLNHWKRTKKVEHVFNSKNLQIAYINNINTKYFKDEDIQHKLSSPSTKSVYHVNYLGINLITTTKPKSNIETWPGTVGPTLVIFAGIIFLVWVKGENPGVGDPDM